MVASAHQEITKSDLATLTGKACEVGIWAAEGNFLGGIRKVDFATMIGTQIIKQVGTARDNSNKNSFEEVKKKDGKNKPEIRESVKKMPARKHR